jgi:hypothetical protein
MEIKDYFNVDPIEIRKYWDRQNIITRTRSGTVTFARVPHMKITTEIEFDFPVGKQEELDTALATWLLSHVEVTELTYGFKSNKFVLLVKIPIDAAHLPEAELQKSLLEVIHAATYIKT